MGLTIWTTYQGLQVLAQGAGLAKLLCWIYWPNMADCWKHRNVKCFRLSAPYESESFIGTVRNFAERRHRMIRIDAGKLVRFFGNFGFKQ